MDDKTIAIVACFGVVIIVIASVVIIFLCLARRLENDYLEKSLRGGTDKYPSEQGFPLHRTGEQALQGIVLPLPDNE